MQYRLQHRQSAPIYNSHKQAGVLTCFSPPGRPTLHTSATLWQTVCSTLLPHGLLSLFLFLLPALPPSPTSLPANTFAQFLPGLLTALLPFPPADPLSVSLNFLQVALSSLAFNFSFPLSGLTLLPCNPFSPLMPSKTHHWQSLEAAQLYPTLSWQHVPTALPTPPGFMTILQIPFVSNGRLGGWRGETSLMSFLLTTIWKWLQVAPRALEMFVGTRRHPSIIFTLLGKLPAGLLVKQHKIWAKKNQNKSWFSAGEREARAVPLLSDAMLHKAVWPTHAPSKTLKCTLSHFFQPTVPRCSREQVSQLTVAVPVNGRVPPDQNESGSTLCSHIWHKDSAPQLYPITTPKAPAVLFHTT